MRKNRLFDAVLVALCVAGFSLRSFAGPQVDEPDAAKDAPLVSMAYPTTNLALDQSRTPTIYLQVSVSDPDEPILSVRFFVCAASGGTCASSAAVAGTVTSSPYQVQWTLPRALSDRAVSTPYLVWAEAQNTLGQARQSSAIAFTVTQPAPSPTVRLIAPNGLGGEVGFVSPAAPVLYATATPGNTTPASTIAKVEFLDGATVVGTVTAPNSTPTGYTFTWRSPAVGVHSVTARATDSLGDFAVSDALSIYILGASQPPKVALTAPTTGQSFTSRSTIPLTASVVAGTGKIQRVEFIAGTTLIATALSTPYVGSWVNPPSGNYTVTARAIDDMGASTASAAAYLQVLPAPRIPTVVLTAPLPGVTVASTAPLPLSATALAPDGGVGRVDFYAGTTLIGSTSSSPYRFTWATPSVGVLSLTAKAYDLQGVSGTSTPVGVTVINSQPPTVTLSATPGAASYAAPAKLKLVAVPLAPSGIVAKVDFLANGALLATRTTAPYEYAWPNIAAGSYSVTARATDGLNSTGNSAALSIKVVNNAAPSVQLTAPAEGQTLYVGQPVALSATAADVDGSISKLEFLVDGATVGTALTAPYNTIWNAAGTGAHVISARATDNLGTAATAAPLNVIVTANTLPSITLTAPSSGQAFTLGQPIALSAAGTDSDGSISRVEFIVDGAVVAATTTAPFTQSWTSGTAGSHLVTARATDDHGAATVTAPAWIAVTTSTVPLVSLTAPLPNRTFSVGSAVPLGATASVPDGSIARVDFYAGATLLGSSSAAPYALAWTPGSAGTYAITAKAIDNRGVSNISAGVAAKIVTPALTIATPTANTSIAADFVTVSGTYQAPPNSGITISGMIANTDGRGSYFINNFPLTPGANTLNVVLTAPDGQSTTQSVAVTSSGTSAMQVYTETDAAFAPATFTIRLKNRAGTPLKSVAFQNLVGAQLDTSVLDQGTLGKLTYGTSGLYKPTLVITDVAEKTYTQTLTLLVRDRTAMDAMLKAAWSDFAGALSRGDKNSALATMSSTARVKYGPVLDVLAPYMAQIIPTWSPPVTGLLGEEIGEFTVRRNVNGLNQLFFIYFVRDGYGIWRLGSM